MMSGKLIMADGRTAVLDKSGEANWTSQDESLQAALRALYPVDDLSPADGDPEYALMTRAAQELGGIVEWSGTDIEEDQEDEEVY